MDRKVYHALDELADRMAREHGLEWASVVREALAPYVNAHLYCEVCKAKRVPA